MIEYQEGSYAETVALYEQYDQAAIISVAKDDSRFAFVRLKDRRDSLLDDAPVYYDGCLVGPRSVVLAHAIIRVKGGGTERLRRCVGRHPSRMIREYGSYYAWGPWGLLPPADEPERQKKAIGKVRSKNPTYQWLHA